MIVHNDVRGTAHALLKSYTLVQLKNGISVQAAKANQTTHHETLELREMYAQTG